MARLTTDSHALAMLVVMTPTIGILRDPCLAGTTTGHRQDLTVIVKREGNAYVTDCSEMDIANYGDTVGGVHKELIEALRHSFDGVPTEHFDHYPCGKGQTDNCPRVRIKTGVCD